MDTLLMSSALVMGLVGNAHCLGMCGPIALALPVNGGSSGERLLKITVYNLGRLLVYGIIGTLFGLLGKGIQLIGLQQYLSITIGVLIILSVLLPMLVKKIYPANAKVFLWVGKLKSHFARHFQKKSYRSLFTIGLLNGLLPCGLVYMAATASIISGSWYGGALYMVLFGVGTLPVMMALPYFGQYMSAAVRNRLKRLVPVFLIVFGILFIVRGANLGIPYLSPKVEVGESCCQMKCH